MAKSRQVHAKTVIKLDINEEPPVKQPSIGSQSDNTKRRLRLRGIALERAQKTPYPFYGVNHIKISILYIRCRGKLDSANIVGGIADCLQGIFYENDRHLTEIKYREEAKNKGKDSYTITLEKVNDNNDSKIMKYKAGRDLKSKPALKLPSVEK